MSYEEKVDFHIVAEGGEIWTIRSREGMWWRSTSFSGGILRRRCEGGVNQNPRRLS